MQIERYLKEYQPVVYQTFVNSLKKKTLSHAYLLVGETGSPLFDVAKFLAKSIVCDDPSPLACENCITCLRIDSNNYPDIITIDGSKANIKKDDVLNIETRFDKTAYGSKGIMIYIIHLVENMGVEAVNSMLKFLEEPDAEVYAFLTTNNENNVLPTIISRCQTLRIKTINRKEVINEAIKEMGIPEEDAELLSYFYNDAELIAKFLDDEDQRDVYENLKESTLKLLEALNTSNREARFLMEKEIGSQIKSKEEMRFFIDLLVQAYEDLLNLKSSREITLNSYATILSALSEKLPHIEESLVEILKQRNLVNLNLNVALQLDHIINFITKE